MGLRTPYLIFDRFYETHQTNTNDATKNVSNFKKEYFSCQLLSFNFVMKPKMLGMVFLKRNKKTFLCLMIKIFNTATFGKIPILQFFSLPMTQMTHKSSQKCKYLKIGKIAKNAKIPKMHENLAFFAILPN